MKSYFPEAIKQRMKSYLTPNTMSVLSKERIKSSVKMQCERRKRKTEDSELHSKTEQVRWLEKGGLGQGMLWEEFRLFGTKWISFHSNWSLLYPNISFSLPKLRACLLQRQKYCDLGCDTAQARRQLGVCSTAAATPPPRPATGSGTAKGPGEELGIQALARTAWHSAPATPGHRGRCWEHMP